VLQSGDGGCASHCREIVEKFVQSFAAFEIVEEILQRYAGAAEDVRAAENIWILDENLAEGRHILPLDPGVRDSAMPGFTLPQAGVPALLYFPGVAGTEEFG
jgi:hypothetical protein